ncbi:sphingomyelin phosphodiesterase-like [Diabrotica undecimpunctata]|uniref:sphingomyelin phosphodiesterase-like n=1 Tax=Diabrotica undecimpunctata TaxID=50387 RepID=UPI003B63D372
MLGFKILLVTVLCIFSFFETIDLVPIDDNENFDFDEYWDYKLTPHNLPLLKSSRETHLLSAVYQFEEDLTVSSLNNEEELSNNRLPKKIHDVIRNKIPCGVCKLGIGLLRSHLNNGDSMEEIRTKVIQLCVSLKIESEKVCAGFFDVFGPELVPAFNTSVLDSSQTCMMVFGESCPSVSNELHEWSIDIPTNELNVEESQTKRRNVEVPVLKVLHLSDTHLDLDYLEGSPANCDEPLCCRNYSTPSSTEPLVSAGRWGSYNKCDSPKILIEHMLNHIALEHPDIDYIIWTGDLPPHDIWNQTKEGNLKIIQECVEQMFLFFPTTPIFPAVGNHESVPAGHIPPGSSDCLKAWSRNFYSIVDRYKDIVRAQFYGHSHADEFELFYETENYSKPINVAYLGPSITTYENHNPAYRIYYIEGDFSHSNRDVLDHETWTTDLEHANKGHNEPVWYKSYSARDTYGMQSLAPEEWNKLIDKMAASDDCFDLFYRHYYRHSPTRPSCDTECKVQILCDLKTGKSQDRKHMCGELQYV